jgi:hypothetical protein
MFLDAIVYRDEALGDWEYPSREKIENGKGCLFLGVYALHSCEKDIELKILT